MRKTARLLIQSSASPPSLSFFISRSPALSHNICAFCSISHGDESKAARETTVTENSEEISRKVTSKPKLELEVHPSSPMSRPFFVSFTFVSIHAFPVLPFLPFLLLSPLINRTPPHLFPPFL